jgi:hypothetical protein
MQTPNTWRELLGTIISDPQEERRLIDLMGIRPITLLRWVQNKTEPRPYFLRQLLDALPQYRDSLLPLMEKEFPGVSELVEDEVPKEIAASFYTHVLETYVATPPSLRFWSICPLILQHILDHLDPEQRGMELLVVRCMPPAGQDQKIHSLREYVALGTPPWQTDLEERNLFLGAESLAAAVLCYLAPARGRRAGASASQAAVADEPAGRALSPAAIRAGTLTASPVTRECSLARFPG